MLPMVLLMVSQVAHMLEVSESQVRRLEASGELPPAIRFGRRGDRRWDLEELQAYLRGNERFNDRFRHAPPVAAAG